MSSDLLLPSCANKNISKQLIFNYHRTLHEHETHPALRLTLRRSLKLKINRTHSLSFKQRKSRKMWKCLWNSQTANLGLNQSSWYFRLLIPFNLLFYFSQFFLEILLSGLFWWNICALIKTLTFEQRITSNTFSVTVTQEKRLNEFWLLPSVLSKRSQCEVFYTLISNLTHAWTISMHTHCVITKLIRCVYSCAMLTDSCYRSDLN